jgi:hypothetical protein
VDFPDDHSFGLQLNIARRLLTDFCQIRSGLFGFLRQLILKRAPIFSFYSLLPIFQPAHESRNQCVACYEYDENGKESQPENHVKVI